jgi:dCMP deaminase
LKWKTEQASQTNTSKWKDNDLKKLGRPRPKRHEHFLNRARVVAEMSTCLRRKVGAIIINKDGVELSSGYSGAPRNTKHCSDLGSCLRMDLKIPSGQQYELCRSVHAEQNAIINAARTGASIVDGVLYISSEKLKGAYSNRKELEKIYGPCIICKKEIINAGLTEVHMREEGIGEKSYNLDQIRELLALEEEEWRKKYKSGKFRP